MKISTKKLVLLAMLAAMAYIMVFVVRIPMVLFLKYEPKDVIITVGGFLFGPVEAFLISLVVSLVEMFTISETGIIGAVMNLLSTCSFACTAALIYRKKHTLTGAVLGLAAGTAVMTGVMLLWNWLITPLYMGIPRSAVEPMLLSVFLPFNVLKAGINSGLLLAVYKPIANALRHLGLLEERPREKLRSRAGMYLLAAVLLITCILGALVLAGKL